MSAMGGGGHARVGAISFPPDQAGSRHGAVAAEIAAELRRADSDGGLRSDAHWPGETTVIFSAGRCALLVRSACGYRVVV